MSKKKVIILNSTLLYVLAFLITTILHEFAHAIIGHLNGSQPILHHNYVEHLTSHHLSISQQVSIALAGPIFSLFQGLIAGGIFLKLKEKKLIHLFLLWFAVLGFNNFFGYLMTGPLFSVGDIGKAYLLANVPVFMQIFLALLGAAALLFIAYKLTTPFLEFSYKENWIHDGRSRKNFSFHILILPWIIGSVIISFLYLPIIALISIIYPVMSGMVFIFPWQNAIRVSHVNLSSSTQLGKFSILSICLVVIVALIFKFVLAPGIHI